jgi:hypothetical protein
MTDQNTKPTCIMCNYQCTLSFIHIKAPRANLLISATPVQMVTTSLSLTANTILVFAPNVISNALRVKPMGTSALHARKDTLGRDHATMIVLLPCLPTTMMFVKLA